MWSFLGRYILALNRLKETVEPTKYSWHWMFNFKLFLSRILFYFLICWSKPSNSTRVRTSKDLSVFNLFSLIHSTGNFEVSVFVLNTTAPAESCKSFLSRFFRWIQDCFFSNLSMELKDVFVQNMSLLAAQKGKEVWHLNAICNGIYSSLFRAQASGGHSKARETRDAEFMQKLIWFALIGLGRAQPRVCECPPPQIPVSQSPF